jgi:hypothetical protein
MSVILALFFSIFESIVRGQLISFVTDNIDLSPNPPAM